MCGPEGGEAVSAGILLGGLRRLGNRLLVIGRPSAAAGAGLWIALIWGLSSTAVPPTPRTFFWAWISNLTHAPLFGILALLFSLALPRGEGRRAWPSFRASHVALVLALVALYGGIDEWHQSFSPVRDANPLDVLTDLVGGTCVLTLAIAVRSVGATELRTALHLLLAVLFCAGAAALAV